MILRSVEPEVPDHLAILDWQPVKHVPIFSADGTLISEDRSVEQTYLTFDQIPPTIVSAFVAAEDGRYWMHNGIDIWSILRAAGSNLFRIKTRSHGASTITQQLVKRLLVGDAYSYKRKLIEAIAAIRLERDASKEKILEIYLNEVYLGAGATGIYAASHAYFGKEPGQLNLAEAATLAGLPKAPSALNPHQNPKGALKRRNYVLDRLEELKLVDPFRLSIARSFPLDTAPAPHKEPVTAFAYAKSAIMRELSRAGGDQKSIGDLSRRTTSLNAWLQSKVHKALRRALVLQDRKAGYRGPLLRNLPMKVDWQAQELKAPQGAEDWDLAIIRNLSQTISLETRNGNVEVSSGGLNWALRQSDYQPQTGDLVLIGDIGNGPELVQIPMVNGAMVALDPQTGGILAYAGGFSFAQSQFDRVALAKRQPGSTLKPLVYLAGFEAGYEGNTPLLDIPIEIDVPGSAKVWKPRGGRTAQSPLVSMRQSLARSRNHSTVRLLYNLGLPALQKTAEEARFALPENLNYSVALGAIEKTPLQMAELYSYFASGGRPVKATFFPPVRKPDEPISPVAIAKLNSALSDVAIEGTGRDAFKGYPYAIAAKSGTTNQSRDIWFVSYNSQLVLVTWIGRDDNQPLGRGSFGGAIPAEISREIWDGLPREIKKKELKLPSGAVERFVPRLDAPDEEYLEVFSAS
ncbi:transglycosylase domain-containing protein [Pseudovibrio ascidiaceicola]|uniref:transglycosylase domain-containing protein n=1 Tax=Pseudovibrio ascidiaceicola TaxID=285279 RepID=UPI003D36B1AD